MGDDESQDKASKEEKESKKLSLLKEHIEKRKRTAATSLDVEDQKETPKKTKRVKLKDRKKKSSSSQPNDPQEEQVLEEESRQRNPETEIDIQSSKDHSKDESSLEQTSFTVIGGKSKKEEASKVSKTLPEWLSNPVVIETDLNANLLSVENLKCLSPHILKQLKFIGINSLFPVQKAVIPAVLDSAHQGSLFCVGGDRPSDICVSAPTGSGKTLSYVVPIVQTLARHKVCLLQALILLPTKDLACQVKQVFDVLIEGTSLKVGLACGNKAFAKEQESLIGQR